MEIDIEMSSINYFDFFEIKEAFFIDEKHLQERFYTYSKLYHPDFHAMKSQEEQAIILDKSTINNKAFLVLKNFYTRLEYILQQHDVLLDQEKYALDPAFLMEMMEINEQIMDLSFDMDENLFQKVSQNVQGIQEQLETGIEQACKEFDSEPSDANVKLNKIKDLWYRRKYLLRIKDSLSKFSGK